MEFPEEDENREKDYLIAKCPTLRTFVDYDLQTNIAEWIKKINETPGPNLDLNATSMIVELVDDANSQNVFEKGVSNHDEIITATALVTMGYELGTTENIYLFYGDLYETLVRQKLMRNTYEGAAATLVLLKYGVELNEKALDEVPDAFKGFTFDLD